MKELEARLLTHIKRHRGELHTKQLRVADIIFDTQAMRVTRTGEVIKLSKITLQMLKILMRESPNLMTREQLESEIWVEDTADSDTLRSHLYNLRKSIDKPHQSPLLHIIPSMGYKLCEEAQL